MQDRRRLRVLADDRLNEVEQRDQLALFAYFDERRDERKTRDGRVVERVVDQLGDVSPGEVFGIIVDGGGLFLRQADKWEDEVLEERVDVRLQQVPGCLRTNA